MKKVLRVVGWLLAVVAGLAIAAYAIAWGIAKSRYEMEWVAHDVSFPIPFPLDDAELAALPAGTDPEAVALERAVARGARIVAARAGCSGCHGAEFGGANLVDEWMLGRWAAPNLTTGQGSVTIGFGASDWDHAVRHGLRHGGRTSTMPSVEFTNLSDRELSDIVAFIRSKPPVDRRLGSVRFGPVFAFIFAGAPDFMVAFDMDHQAPHPREPPQAAVNAEFGAHLAQVCRGCHGPRLSGGKIQGDPGMPIVANLTPHETGLKNWTDADFMRAMREGKRPDGSAISEYMPWQAYANMSDDELKAIYAYLKSVPPREKGNR
jgi:mono/diheme cytochrome c family protein